MSRITLRSDALPLVKRLARLKLTSKSYSKAFAAAHQEQAASHAEVLQALLIATAFPMQHSQMQQNFHLTRVLCYLNTRPLT